MRQKDYDAVVEVTDRLNRKSDFDSYLDEVTYGWAQEDPDFTVLDPETLDRYTLVEIPDYVLVVEPTGDEWEFQGAIVMEDEFGGVGVRYFTTLYDSTAAWDKLVQRYDTRR